MCHFPSRRKVISKKALKIIHDIMLIFQDDFVLTCICLHWKIFQFFITKISQESQNNTELTGKSELIIKKQDEYNRNIKKSIKFNFFPNTKHYKATVLNIFCILPLKCQKKKSVTVVIRTELSPLFLVVIEIFLFPLQTLNDFYHKKLQKSWILSK